MSELVWLRDINESRVCPGRSAKWDLSELMAGQDGWEGKGTSREYGTPRTGSYALCKEGEEVTSAV